LVEGQREHEREEEEEGREQGRLHERMKEMECFETGGLGCVGRTKGGAGSTGTGRSGGVWEEVGRMRGRMKGGEEAREERLLSLEQRDCFALLVLYNFEKEKGRCQNKRQGV